MDVNKEDVKRLVEHLELPYFYDQLKESLQLAKSDAMDENLQRLSSAIEILIIVLWKIDETCWFPLILNHRSPKNIFQNEARPELT